MRFGDIQLLPSSELELQLPFYKGFQKHTLQRDKPRQ